MACAECGRDSNSNKLFVEGGSFMMGDFSGDGREDERPLHDFLAFWNRVNFAHTDRHPVVCVSWYDAIEYCNWLSEKNGLVPSYTVNGDDVSCDFGADGFRLRTEAEWEYAARSRGLEQKYARGNGDPYRGDEKAANVPAIAYLI